jgi:hypothetical protein
MKPTEKAPAKIAAKREMTVSFGEKRIVYLTALARAYELFEQRSQRMDTIWMIGGPHLNTARQDLFVPT